MRVLIVADDATAARHLRRLLERAGYEAPHVAGDEAQAYAIGERIRPEVALVMLDGEPGRGIAAARAIQKWWGVSSILISGHRDIAACAADLDLAAVVPPWADAAVLRALDHFADPLGRVVGFVPSEQRRQRAAS